MSSDATRFVGDIPGCYDRDLGPLIFSGFAADIAVRAAALSPMRVLETAAGTGIATRRLRDGLPPEAHLTATDLNIPMIDVARAKFGPAEHIAFQTADATALPFPDRSFDLVVCQFGLMFLPDKDKGHREAFRVLVPGGHWLFSVWDSHRYNAFGRLAHDTAGGFFPADPPQFYRVPFNSHQIDPIKEALIDAGFADIGATVVGLERTVPDAAAFARGLVFGNPLVEEIRARGRVEPDRVADRLTEMLRREFGPDPGHMTIQAIVFSARRPEA